MDNRGSYIYAILRSELDWRRLKDPALWSYDKQGLLRVEPEVFELRAAPNVWTSAGWDRPPTAYPAMAGRILNPPPEPEETPEPGPEEPTGPRPGRKRRQKGRRGTLVRQYRLLPEIVEQIDLLCEAYGLGPAAVLSRLVSEAYRRDVVDSGLIAILADDSVTGIIAPT